MTIKEIQKELKVTADGIFGPKTAAALAAAGYDVVLDPGHTADNAREHPKLWPQGYWEQGTGAKIAERLGFVRNTNDSVEHMVNVSVAEALKAALEARGHRVLLFDDPRMENNAEIGMAYRLANAAKCKAFISIHANASTGVQHANTNKASGTVVFYRKGCSASAQLAEALADACAAARRSTGGPDNRAEHVMAGQYTVIRKATETRRAILVETAFYDNTADLSWLAENYRGLAESMAKAINDII